MWIEKTKNGKYQYRERYVDPVTGKRKCVSVVMDNKTRMTQKLAKQALDHKIAERIRRPYAPKSVSLKELQSLYVDWQYKNLKEQTASNTDMKLNTITRLLGEDIQINELTAWYVKDRLQAEKPCTYNDRVKTFKAMIRWAYRNELVTDVSYLDKIERAKDTPIRIKNEDKFLEHDEITKLLAHMAPHWKLLTQFLILSGMRIGEVMDLEVCDVNMKKREIDINSSFSLRIRVSSSVKTETSNRIIYIQDELMECVKDINTYRKALEKKFKKIIPFFFPYTDGGRLHYDAYRKYLKETTDQYIGRKLTPHALRHTHTSLLAEAGIPLEQITRRLGHADSKITREVYLHITSRLKDKENERHDMLKLI
ncbi:MAG: site-specific integrase [Lachnospiraceae bacterium]|nr:site-specific integrase [Lachnospiraceae bacterium]